MNLTLQEAKERVLVEHLWREFGYEGEPKKQCRCPFHEDGIAVVLCIQRRARRGSAIAGCGEGSVIDFLIKAKGIPEEEACKDILRRAGGATHEPPPRREPPKPGVVQLPPLDGIFQGHRASRWPCRRPQYQPQVEFAYHWFQDLCYSPEVFLPSHHGFSPMPHSDALRPVGLTASRIPLSGHSENGKATPLGRFAQKLARGNSTHRWLHRKTTLGSRNIAIKLSLSKAGRTISPLASLSSRKRRERPYPSR